MSDTVDALIANASASASRSRSPRRGLASNLDLASIHTPLGEMVAGVSDGRLLLLEFADRRHLPRQLEMLLRLQPMCPRRFSGAPASLDETRAWLDGYFAAGALPAPPRRAPPAFATPGTPFQRTVWDALSRIPEGHTTSYGELARAIGKPDAVRAVAAANGANRIAILVPCHRVVGADGRLTGYAGGLERKRALLDIEARRHRPVGDPTPAPRHDSRAPDQLTLGLR